MRPRAAVSNLIRHKSVRRLLIGSTVFLLSYMLSYVVLFGLGERKAKQRGQREYSLMFDNREDSKFEVGVSLAYWPIYSVDYIYVDEGLRPWEMPRKEMGTGEYLRCWKIYLRERLGLE